MLKKSSGASTPAGCGAGLGAAGQQLQQALDATGREVPGDAAADLAQSPLPREPSQPVTGRPSYAVPAVSPAANGLQTSKRLDNQKDLFAAQPGGPRDSEPPPRAAAGRAEAESSSFPIAGGAILCTEARNPCCGHHLLQPPGVPAHLPQLHEDTAALPPLHLTPGAAPLEPPCPSRVPGGGRAPRGATAPRCQRDSGTGISRRMQGGVPRLGSIPTSGIYRAFRW